MLGIFIPYPYNIGPVRSHNREAIHPFPNAFDGNRPHRLDF